jgi:FKBP-type peptidyl-prolyl cis-trans isomerase
MPFLAKGKNVRVYLKVVEKFRTDSLAQNDFMKEKRNFDSLITIKENAVYEKSQAAFDSLIRTIKEPLKKLDNGVYVQMLQKGNGAKITKGDSVAVIYKGTLVNGTLFDSNTSQTPYVIMASMGGAVEGFDSGVASLSFGDKAKIFIPSKLGYGAQGSGDRIPPFSNLIFEVEVKDGRKGK